ncbi:MAG TPA: putative nucleotidyltransferase substrate binding domain-containing protein, partial [Nitrospirota bacterium]|nr:putative nucleotidyltransferase substrate binding domain-containing protein [Nitrospirota bacterium]
IKMRGLCPIIDLARLAALEAGVYHTSTLARFAELKDRNGTVSSAVHELEQAFEFLMSLRLGRQFRQIEEGRAPDNRIDPRGLGALERRQLKETFRLIASVQEAAKQKYRSWIAI